jgi:glyoxylase-like metal-dependent hydrolase (beta-lactamase superfamily II)
MSLPENVYTFPFDAQFGERTMTLHPSAIETESGLLLLDTGLPHKVENVIGQMDDAGYGLDDIGMVLLTHQDGDHAGGLATILDRANPTVLAHEIAAPVIDGREQPRAGPDGERYPPARVDVELGGESTINTRVGPAKIIETPGHTPCHVSVYLPDEKLLLAGDALGLYGDTLDAPEPEVTMDTEQALESVGKLADLDIDHILCYHGGYTDEGTERLEEILASH